MQQDKQTNKQVNFKEFLKLAGMTNKKRIKAGEIILNKLIKQSQLDLIKQLRGVIGEKNSPYDIDKILSFIKANYPGTDLVNMIETSNSQRNYMIDEQHKKLDQIEKDL